MTRIETATAQKLLRAGYVAVVRVHYAYADKQPGDIISKHRSYDAAQKAARKDATGHWRIDWLSDFAGNV